MKGPTKNQTSSPHWMAAHARLKNVFMENEKYHDLMTWLNYVKFIQTRFYLGVSLQIYQTVSDHFRVHAGSSFITGNETINYKI